MKLLQLKRLSMRLWSSVKSFQSVAVPYRYRIGCRMMCPTGCLFPLSASCSALVLLACRFLIHFAHPPRRACRASLRPASSRRFVPSCLSVGHVCLVSPAHLVLPALATSARPTLLVRPASRVGWRGVLRLALISSCVPPTVMCSACRLAFRSSSECDC